MKTKEQITWRKATEQEILNGSNEMIEVSRESVEVQDLSLNWAALRLGLMTSRAFTRILSNQSSVNMVAYGALQTILSTESNENHLLQMLQLTMTFTEDEKDEINLILLDNNFSVQL